MIEVAIPSDALTGRRRMRRLRNTKSRAKSWKNVWKVKETVVPMVNAILWALTFPNKYVFPI